MTAPQLPMEWFNRGIQAYGDVGSMDKVWLWPASATALPRVEAAYWWAVQRVRRAVAAFTVAQQRIAAVGGVAYSRCHGVCEGECFYRFITELSPSRIAGEPPQLVSMLYDHVRRDANGWYCYDRTYRPLPESERLGGPIHLDVGEAYWRAEDCIKRANTRMLRWRAALAELIETRLKRDHPPRGVQSARVEINGRDYWYVARLKYDRYFWVTQAFPEEDRVEVRIDAD